MPLAAHEFWIDPVAHHVAPGDGIAANLRVGQKFDGDIFPYLSAHFEAFTITDARGTRDYSGDQGDRPALEMEAAEPGLTILTYVSRPSALVYRKWEKFLSYTKNEGLKDAVAIHLADDLPKTGFREEYQRHAKALIQVGPVRPDARETAQGLDLELVALGNPFDPAQGTLPVALLRFGKPAPDVQIAIFRKGPEGVTVAKLRTDEEGRADIPLEDGARYLLNAVIMDRTERDGVDWDSDWASLTFARP